MKYLYLWNDLSVLKEKSDLIVEEMICDFINYMNSVNSKFCEYHLLSNDQLLKWLEHVQLICRDRHCITIGKRPSEIVLNKAETVHKIMLQRTIDNGGFTRGVVFKNQTNKILDECIEKYDCLDFIEDVSVNGTTLQFIADYLQERQFKGKCIFHIFSSNDFAIKKLMKPQRGFEIEVDSGFHMKGKPIEASTLLCLHDLLFEKLGNESYINRLDLMKLFFFDETEKLIEMVNTIRTCLYTQNEKINALGR